MVLISFTNCVVDDFSYGKKRPGQLYNYFLSHMHSDHYQGITPLWNFGDIYCSPVSKRLLLSKFPNLPGKVHALELNTPHTIRLHEEHADLEIMVTLYDANHCPGAVLFVFEGYMGRIVHTGDMRWHNHMFSVMDRLFPAERRTADLAACAVDVDELIFDNTYCDEVFRFPARSEALGMIVEIVTRARAEGRAKRVYLCVDSLGKEEIMITLARHFKTRVVVSEQRYAWLQCMEGGVDMALFSTCTDDGWIEVQRRGFAVSGDQKCVNIQLTGWANVQHYVTTDNVNYLVPYSLHSNYLELEYFVRGVQPARLRTVVGHKHAKSDKVNRISQYSSYMITLSHLKQRGVEFFVEKYTRPGAHTPAYALLARDAQKGRAIYDRLGIDAPDENGGEDENSNSEKREKPVATLDKFFAFAKRDSEESVSEGRTAAATVTTQPVDN